MDLQFKKNMFCIGLFKGLIDKGLLLCVSGCFFFGGGVGVGGVSFSCFHVNVVFNNMCLLFLTLLQTF